MAVVRVRYKGLSDIREMSRKDLSNIGIGVEKDLVWSNVGRARHNDVYIADPSDELLDQLKLEGTFTVSEVDSDTLREVDDKDIIQATVADDTGGVVRDTTQGREHESVNPKGPANAGGSLDTSTGADASNFTTPAAGKGSSTGGKGTDAGSGRST